MKDAKKPDQLNEVCERNIGSDIAKIRELLSSPRVSSPAILRSILRPIPTGILIIPVGIEN